MEDPNARPRTLTNPKTFVIEVGSDGFNAFLFRDQEKAMSALRKEDLELFAASSSVSTFLRVAETILNSHGASLKLSVVAPDGGETGDEH